VWVKVMFLFVVRERESSNPKQCSRRGDSLGIQMNQGAKARRERGDEGR